MTNLTLGQKASDKLTEFCGSWTFIIIFLSVIIVWISLNGFFLVEHLYGGPFDPFPFILLNLTLSCLTAIQAPIILMSQVRQAERDRRKEEQDFQVDKKAEIEIEDMQKDLDEIKGMIKKLEK